MRAVGAGLGPVRQRGEDLAHETRRRLGQVEADDQPALRPAADHAHGDRAWHRALGLQHGMGAERGPPSGLRALRLASALILNLARPVGEERVGAPHGLIDRLARQTERLRQALGRPTALGAERNVAVEERQDAAGGLGGVAVAEAEAERRGVEAKLGHAGAEEAG